MSCLTSVEGGWPVGSGTVGLVERSLLSGAAVGVSVAVAVGVAALSWSLSPPPHPASRTSARARRAGARCVRCVTAAAGERGRAYDPPVTAAPLPPGPRAIPLNLLGWTARPI